MVHLRDKSSNERSPGKGVHVRERSCFGRGLLIRDAIYSERDSAMGRVHLWRGMGDGHLRVASTCGSILLLKLL